MSLFDATVAQVVKDVGDSTLIAVQNRSSADYCKILSVVERKTRSWHVPWKSSYKYIPTEITLNDVLKEPIDDKDLVASSILLEKYQSTPSFHRSGKIGGKIADEFDVDVDVNETMEVSLKLGNVTKKEIVWQKLYNAVHNKVVNVGHPLLKAIKKSKKRSLFVINMVVTAGSELSLEKDTAVEGDLGGKPQVALNLNASGSSDSKKHRQYTIPPGTTFGYSCYEIKIDKNGLLNLKLGEDVVDAASEERSLTEEKIQSELVGLLLDPACSDIITELRNILKETPICAFMLNIVVESAVEALEGEDLDRITDKQLLKMFPDKSAKACLKLLERIDFCLDKKKGLRYPQDTARLPLLKSLHVLLECLSEMSSLQKKALAECDLSNKHSILYVMRKVIESEVVTQDDENLEGMFSGDTHGRKFLKSIGFNLVRPSGSSIAQVQFVPRTSDSLNLHTTQIAVIGLCSV